MVLGQEHTLLIPRIPRNKEEYLPKALAQFQNWPILLGGRSISRTGAELQFQEFKLHPNVVTFTS